MNIEMLYLNEKRRSCRATTLLELVVALAVITISFAALVPMLVAIRNSWGSQEANAELLQNGRVLVDHVHRNLSKATRITDVSDSSETNGYVEFQDADGVDLRYDVNSISAYVEFGPVGDLADLAGPVNQLRFTCYDGNDFANLTTDVNSIRLVQVQTTLVNSSALGRDKTFTTCAYIRANYQDDDSGWLLSEVSGSLTEFDTSTGKSPALCKIDEIHYLCAWDGPGSHGWAAVLSVNEGSWVLSIETPFEYDTSKAVEPALAQIDPTHYLCAYRGEGDDGWAAVLTVNPGTWTVSREQSFEFDERKCQYPALSRIDGEHYLCAYQGEGDDGFAAILTVDPGGGWAIDKGALVEFDTDKGLEPALCQIDSAHYLCAYGGKDDDGFATVLTVDTGSLTISAETPFEYDSSKGRQPALAKIEDTRYLCSYAGPGDHGFAVVLTVNVNTWTISRAAPLEYDTSKGEEAALAKINVTDYICGYRGDSDDGWAAVLRVSAADWSVTKESEFEFDTRKGLRPALSMLDHRHCLCAYQGDGDDGSALVLDAAPPILP
ncbi:MAG: type II secretion system protein [Phycisphaerales bacterium]|nr:MAG: type II secretion system protein [Phycisphaerales bacterium]